MQTRYLPADTWRALQAQLANARPTPCDTDRMTAIAEILADFGIVPDYCRDEEGHRYLRRRNFI